MEYKLSKFAATAIAVGALFLSGCGGGGGSDAPPANTGTTESTAFYVDSAVQGITVTCGNESGKKVSVTDENGMFYFEGGAAGVACSFTIGDIVLGGAIGVVEGQTIIEDDIDVARFLQSMDMDGDASNGIQIAENTADILAANGINTLPRGDTELADSVAAMQSSNPSYQGRYVDTAEAQAHLQETLAYYGQPAQPQPTPTPDPGTPPDNPNPTQPDEPNPNPNPQQPAQPDQPQQPDNPNPGNSQPDSGGPGSGPEPVPLQPTIPPGGPDPDNPDDPVAPPPEGPPGDPVEPGPPPPGPNDPGQHDRDL